VNSYHGVDGVSMVPSIMRPKPLPMLPSKGGRREAPACRGRGSAYDVRNSGRFQIKRRIFQNVSISHKNKLAYQFL
jgi:hypothetical protein